MAMHQLNRHLAVPLVLDGSQPFNEFVAGAAHAGGLHKFRCDVCFFGSNKHQVTAMIVQVFGIGRFKRFVLGHVIRDEIRQRYSSFSNRPHPLAQNRGTILLGLVL